ncbi:MAG: hypothetical protein EHM57_02600 [Actinobacteria bacterium]|nr:MAG: hypothetical protein EHM57_02600 [Actinomycetota bacterium]
MPVIVVGADTDLGAEVVAALVGRAGEVRAFVTDPGAGDAMRRLGVKVAVGDVSDGSHIAGAAHDCFAAVFDPLAAADARERAFAATADAVMRGWAGALRDAAVRRAIWLGDEVPAVIATAVAESVAVKRDDAAPAIVRRLDEMASLPSDGPGAGGWGG